MVQASYFLSNLTQGQHITPKILELRAFRHLQEINQWMYGIPNIHAQSIGMIEENSWQQLASEGIIDEQERRDICALVSFGKPLSAAGTRWKDQVR
jgi:hypothetical protein